MNKVRPIGEKAEIHAASSKELKVLSLKILERLGVTGAVLQSPL